MISVNNLRPGIKLICKNPIFSQVTYNIYKIKRITSKCIIIRTFLLSFLSGNSIFHLEKKCLNKTSLWDLDLKRYRVMRINETYCYRINKLWI